MNTPAFTLYKEREDPEVFLSTFANQAHRWNLKEGEYMRFISGLVTGNMSIILNSLPPESMNDYNAFKDAV